MVKILRQEMVKIIGTKIKQARVQSKSLSEKSIALSSGALRKIKLTKIIKPEVNKLILITVHNVFFEVFTIRLSEFI